MLLVSEWHESASAVAAAVSTAITVLSALVALFKAGQITRAERENRRQAKIAAYYYELITRPVLQDLASFARDARTILRTGQERFLSECRSNTPPKGGQEVVRGVIREWKSRFHDLSCDVQTRCRAWSDHSGVGKRLEKRMLRALEELEDTTISAIEKLDVASDKDGWLLEGVMTLPLSRLNGLIMECDPGIPAPTDRERKG